jgi:hypothetical protein
MPAHWGKK